MAQLTLPSAVAGKRIHIVLELSDNGRPSRQTYRRVIVSVK